MTGILIAIACFSALAGFALAQHTHPHYPGARDVDWSKPNGGFFEDEK